MSIKLRIMMYLYLPFFSTQNRNYGIFFVDVKIRKLNKYNLTIYQWLIHLAYTSKIKLLAHTWRRLHIFLLVVHCRHSKSIVAWVIAMQIFSVLYRKIDSYALSNQCFFYFFSSFMYFFSCSPFRASPCGDRGKTMMIAALIQNVIRKSTIYLTFTICMFFSFFFGYPISQREKNSVVELIFDRLEYYCSSFFLNASLCKQAWEILSNTKSISRVIVFVF